jgi:hypothetical protein
MSLGASKLDNKDTFGKSDPFVRIAKARESGAWVPVLKTEVGARERVQGRPAARQAGRLRQAGRQAEAGRQAAQQLVPNLPLVPSRQVINNNLNPTWCPFKASMSQLCNCDPHRPLLLEVRCFFVRRHAGFARRHSAGCASSSRRPVSIHLACPFTLTLPSNTLQVFDSDPGGTHELIGSCQASLAVLQDAAAQGRGLPLLHPKKARKPGYVSSGAWGQRGDSVAGALALAGEARSALLKHATLP